MITLPQPRAALPRLLRAASVDRHHNDRTRS